MQICVAVAGAAGKMGKEVVKAVSAQSDLKLVAAIDPHHEKNDAGLLAGIGKIGVAVSALLEESLQSSQPKVLVDFTRHESAMKNIRTSLKHKIPCVVGTTGFSENDYHQIKAWCKEHETPAFIAPNFAMGAVLLMKFAQEASKHFAWSEIIELHHEKKLDAPSGTALRTAKLMLENRPQFNREKNQNELVPGACGASMDGIRIHSVRLPGLVAHQEVLFGDAGQLLTLRHDSFSRESFMPGVLLAIRKVSQLQGLVIGLEQLLP